MENNNNYMKKLLILSIVMLSVLLSGCSSDTTINDLFNTIQEGEEIYENVSKTIGNQTFNTTPSVPRKPDDPNKANVDLSNNVNSISIASWNIENLGKTKVEDGRIVDIVDTLDEYDIIGIQEVSNLYEKNDNSCNRNSNAPNHENYGLIRNSFETNLNDSKWGISISPYVDSERYMFVYDRTKVTNINCEIVEDSNSGQKCEKNDDIGLMKYEPYVCQFDINGEKVYLMTAHTSPSNNLQELFGLKIFYDVYNEKGDIILLGDLNYGADKTSLTKNNPFMNDNIISYDDTTTAQSDNGYDVFIYDTNNFRPNGNGVVKVEEELSDHYLIWSEWVVN